MSRFVYRNAGIHPCDPDYDDSIDYDSEKDAFDEACIEREEFNRELNN